jgi:probable HAF family extracellular repeat protein
MLSHPLRCSAAMVLSFLGFVAAANGQPAYRVVDVGPSDSTFFCKQGAAINNVGLGIATQRIDGPGTVRSYVVDTAGMRRDIGTLEGGDTYATGINDDGVVIGQSSFQFGSIATFHAFVWTARDGIRDLTPESSGSYTCDINARGDVVGFSGFSAPLNQALHAFIYTGGTLFDLNDLEIEGGREPWQYFESAVSINEHGQILGIGYIDGVRHGFIMTPTSSTTNLLVDGGFEGTDPPSLAPGWVSDNPLRQTPAFSETHQPRSGTKNAACWTPDNLDCGMYQEVVAPQDGTYVLTFYSNADRPGGLVGLNINGQTRSSVGVQVNGFGVYSKFTDTFVAVQGSVIRVWMYSPPTPGYVVIDDVSVVIKNQ